MTFLRATLMETAAALGSELGIDPICAIVNNKTEDLSYTVYGPKQVEFLDYTVKQGGMSMSGRSA